MSGDEASIAVLLELNGMPRWVAFEERFVVTKEGGEVLAALRYRTEPKRLLLGLLVADPWVEERLLVRAPCGGVYELAREMGVGEVRAVSPASYPREAGYRRSRSGWRLDAARSGWDRSRELPAGGWRKMLALLGVGAVPFFRGFGEREDLEDRGCG